VVIIAGAVLVSGACCIRAVFGGRGQDRKRGGLGCTHIGGRTVAIVAVHSWEVIITLSNSLFKSLISRETGIINYCFL